MDGRRPEERVDDLRHLGISAKGFIAIRVPGPTLSFPI